MMALAELQQAFQRRVLAGERAIEAELACPAKGDFAARLRAYVDGYSARLIEALATTYPALRRTLGEDEFERHMRVYIEATPSHHTSVRYYGAAVAESLAAQSDLLATQIADAILGRRAA